MSTGQYAGVIAEGGNPPDDIALMENVDSVMQEGTVYTRDGKPAPADFTSNPGQ